MIMYEFGIALRRLLQESGAGASLARALLEAHTVMNFDRATRASLPTLDPAKFPDPSADPSDPEYRSFYTSAPPKLELPKDIKAIAIQAIKHLHDCGENDPKCRAFIGDLIALIGAHTEDGYTRDDSSLYIKQNNPNGPARTYWRISDHQETFFMSTVFHSDLYNDLTGSGPKWLSDAIDNGEIIVNGEPLDPQKLDVGVQGTQTAAYFVAAARAVRKYCDSHPDVSQSDRDKYDIIAQIVERLNSQRRVKGRQYSIDADWNMLNLSLAYGDNDQNHMYNENFKAYEDGLTRPEHPSNRMYKLSSGPMLQASSRIDYEGGQPFKSWLNEHGRETGPIIPTAKKTDGNPVRVKDFIRDNGAQGPAISGVLGTDGKQYPASPYPMLNLHMNLKKDPIIRLIKDAYYNLSYVKDEARNYAKGNRKGGMQYITMLSETVMDILCALLDSWASCITRAIARTEVNPNMNSVHDVQRAFNDALRESRDDDSETRGYLVKYLKATGMIDRGRSDDFSSSLKTRSLLKVTAPRRKPSAPEGKYLSWNGEVKRPASPRKLAMLTASFINDFTFTNDDAGVLGKLLNSVPDGDPERLSDGLRVPKYVIGPVISSSREADSAYADYRTALRNAGIRLTPSNPGEFADMMGDAISLLFLCGKLVRDDNSPIPSPLDGKSSQSITVQLSKFAVPDTIEKSDIVDAVSTNLRNWHDSFRILHPNMDSDDYRARCDDFISNLGNILPVVKVERVDPIRPILDKLNSVNVDTLYAGRTPFADGIQELQKCIGELGAKVGKGKVELDTVIDTIEHLEGLPGEIYSSPMYRDLTPDELQSADTTATLVTQLTKMLWDAVSSSYE